MFHTRTSQYLPGTVSGTVRYPAPGARSPSGTARVQGTRSGTIGPVRFTLAGLTPRSYPYPVRCPSGLPYGTPLTGPGLVLIRAHACVREYLYSTVQDKYRTVLVQVPRYPKGYRGVQVQVLLVPLRVPKEVQGTKVRVRVQVPLRGVLVRFRTGPCTNSYFLGTSSGSTEGYSLLSTVLVFSFEVRENKGEKPLALSHYRHKKPKAFNPGCVSRHKPPLSPSENKFRV